MPLARLAPALAAIVLPAVFVAAQQDRSPPPRSNAWTAMAEAAFADLDDEAKYAAACERLERAGPRVVQFVRERLTAAARANASSRQVRGLLYVLAKRGKEALPALPDLRAMLCELSDLERNPEVDPALCWTLIALLPFVELPVATEILRDAGPLIHRTGDEGALLRDIAEYGNAPDEQQILRRATHSRFYLAACRWLVTRAEDLPFDREKCAAALDTFRRTLGTGPGRGFGSTMDAEITDAWLAVSRDPIDALAAVCLLRHWDPARRVQAIAWLRAQGAALPVFDRVRLGAALWDPEASVRTHAAAALAAWGQAGVVGLAALRHLQQSHADVSYRALCGSTADALLASFDDAPPADRALLTAVDRCLQGRPPEAPPVAPASATGLARIGDALHLAVWCPADRLDQALRQIEAAGELDSDAAHAVFTWRSLGDHEVGATAWSWMARHPAATRDALAVRIETTYADLMVELVSTARSEVRGEAIEAMAWLELAGATTDDLLHHSRSGTPRHVVRALAELLLRDPDQARLSPEQLQRLLAGEVEPEVRFVKKVLGLVVRDVVHRADLRPHVRVLAALQAAAQGLPLPTDDVALDELLTTWCGSSASDLPTTLARWRRNGELEHRLDAIEADARKRLGVRPHLTWPRLQKP